MTEIFITLAQDKRKLIEVLKATEMPYKVKVTRGGSRSLEQNRYLWGVCYATILEQGDLDGWRNEDLHEYFLGEHFGWETLEGFGKRRMKPLNRSSRLTKMEFVDFIDFIHQKAAEMGIVIPDPE